MDYPIAQYKADIIIYHQESLFFFFFCRANYSNIRRLMLSKMYFFTCIFKSKSGIANDHLLDWNDED